MNVCVCGGGGGGGGGGGVGREGGSVCFVCIVVFDQIRPISHVDMREKEIV